jgi:NitT/TauT family transport system substrate-binding protein
VPYLKSIGDFTDLDVDGFISDVALRKAFVDRGQNYDIAVKAATNPSAIGGQDPVCNVAVTDPKLAGEVWLDGQPTTQPAANPDCLLRAVREAIAKGQKVRAAYVPDTEFGTRWFADKAFWVRDRATYLPFDTAAGAAR